MKHYSLKITTKTKKSFKDFFDFINNVTAKLSSLNTSFRNKKTKKVITILKSPHVNKTAQEQFEFRFFSAQLNLYTTLSYKWLILLKKIKTTLFPYANLKIKVRINKNLHNKTHANVINPVNFKLIQLDRLSTNLLKKNKRSSKKRRIKQNNLKIRSIKLRCVAIFIKLFSFYSAKTLTLMFR